MRAKPRDQQRRIGGGRPALGRADRRYHALIFGTGAATLSLELLASRIMTPYFGVSLYIWTGILSITLIFLAVGYRLGGLASESGDAGTLEFLFLAAPVASAAALAFACALYPVLFPLLSEANLIVGSFVAGALLLAVPLLSMAAMNPVLIRLARDDDAGGGPGAGRVFSVSTAGSVAGVLLTAFVFIPNVTNYRALLLLGLGLCGSATLMARASPALSPTGKRRLLIAGAATALLLGVLLAGQARYLSRLADVSASPLVFDVRAEYTSLFGTIKVVDRRARDGGFPPMRLFLQDGLVQNRATLDGVSLSMYTYVLETLARTFAGEGRDVLVLGLGAGIVPRSLQAAGFRVRVVEINAQALQAAREFFAFSAEAVPVHVQDARTFVRRCRAAFDVVVTDLFHGDSTPDYLLTAEFFRDARGCLRPAGAAVLNTLFNGRDDEPNRRLLATVASAFPDVFDFRNREDGSAAYNAFIVGTSGAPPAQIDPSRLPLPAAVADAVGRTLASGHRVPGTMARSALVTDDHNIFSLLNAGAQMAARQAVARQFPPHVLLN